MQVAAVVPFSPTAHLATFKLYQPPLAIGAPCFAYKTQASVQRRCRVPKHLVSRTKFVIAPPARATVAAAAAAYDGSGSSAGRASESDVAFVRQLRVVLAANELSEDSLPSIKEVAVLGGPFLAGAMRTRGYRRVRQLLQLVGDEGEEAGKADGQEARAGGEEEDARVESWSLGSGSGSLGSAPGSAMSVAQQKAKVLQQRMQQRGLLSSSEASPLQPQSSNSETGPTTSSPSTSSPPFSPPSFNPSSSPFFSSSPSSSPRPTPPSLSSTQVTRGDSDNDSSDSNEGDYIAPEVAWLFPSLNLDLSKLDSMSESESETEEGEEEVKASKEEAEEAEEAEELEEGGWEEVEEGSEGDTYRRNREYDGTPDNARPQYKGLQYSDDALQASSSAAYSTLPPSSPARTPYEASSKLPYSTSYGSADEAAYAWERAAAPPQPGSATPYSSLYSTAVQPLTNTATNSSQRSGMSSGSGTEVDWTGGMEAWEAEAVAEAERLAASQATLFSEEAELELERIKSLLASREEELSVIMREMEEAKVVVEYWGEGHEVLLAGSFNGWQSHVPMVPDETSHIPNHDGSRGAMIWEGTLWLYPGHYQVKFIVDGRWTLDQRREVVEGSMGQNNLLVVDWEDDGSSTSNGGSNMASNTFPPTFLR
ncbi:hypothetical protein CLOM_g24417 [Closterium sp. NIES-68]|nr:hypothetical protein CLOM_g24417 [Closterium sp. NIES-68]GJP60834.1 hypothetical protein CLOP_g18050 [Closterium sp. NIES-67]